MRRQWRLIQAKCCQVPTVAAAKSWLLRVGAAAALRAGSEDAGREREHLQVGGVSGSQPSIGLRVGSGMHHLRPLLTECTSLAQTHARAWERCGRSHMLGPAAWHSPSMRSGRGVQAGPRARLHHLPRTQLVRHKAQHARADGQALLVDQHARVPIKLDDAAARGCGVRASGRMKPGWENGWRAAVWVVPCPCLELRGT